MLLLLFFTKDDAVTKHDSILLQNAIAITKCNNFITKLTGITKYEIFKFIKHSYLSLKYVSFL